MVFGKWKQFNKGEIKSRLVFLLFFVILILVVPSSVKADTGLFNGKILTHETDNYLMWLQTRDSSYNYTDRFFIDKIGNVGISTSTPAVKLAIDGGTGQVMDVLGGRIQGLNLIPLADSEAVPRKYLHDNFAPITGGTGSAFLQGGNSFGTTAVLGTNDAYNLDFITSSTTRMTIDTSGNVGIGTNSPGYKLDVYGTSATDAISSQVGYNIDRVTKPIAPTFSYSSGGNVDEGTHYYIVTYVTNIGETLAGESAEVMVTSPNNTVNLTIPTSTDPRVIGRKIYRTKAGEALYYDYLLATINNNTQTSYVDTIADSALTGDSSMVYFKSDTTNNFITLDGVPIIKADEKVTNFGYNAGQSMTTGGRNVFIGRSAGAGVTSATDTVIVGYYAGPKDITGSSNVLIGSYAGRDITSGAMNTTLGSFSLFSGTTGSTNTAIGRSSLSSVNSGSANTALGAYSGESSTGYGNTYLGTYAGRDSTSGNYNILIGYDVQNSLITDSYKLNIGNIIYGDLSIGNIGIATTTPQAKLHVIGGAKMSNLDGSYRVPVADTELVPRKYVDDNFASIVGGASAVFVGLTTNSYNGNQGGYTTANSICAGEYTDSHICTTQEVLYTINSGNSSSVPVTTAWMSGGAPGYTANANDCQGWKSSSHGDYGKVWIKLAVGDDGFGALSWCDETAPFMCCK